MTQQEIRYCDIDPKEECTMPYCMEVCRWTHEMMLEEQEAAEAC